MPHIILFFQFRFFSLKKDHTHTHTYNNNKKKEQKNLKRNINNGKLFRIEYTEHFFRQKNVLSSLSIHNVWRIQQKKRKIKNNE